MGFLYLLNVHSDCVNTGFVSEAVREAAGPVAGALGSGHSGGRPSPACQGLMNMGRMFCYRQYKT